MTDEGFLQAIFDDPEDDAVRLIYADWLEERGDPRGEFIRVQVELARGMATGRQHYQLLVREQQLLREHEKEWTQPLRRWAHSWVFRRGFVEEVAVQLKWFIEAADELFRHAPVRRVHMEIPKLLPPPDRPAYWGALADCPHLRQLTSLHLKVGLGSGGVQAFVVSENLGKLTDLNLSGNRIGDSGARALAGSPLLFQLTHLDLSHNAIGPGGLRALAAALAGTREDVRLRRVDLRVNPLGPAGVVAIHGSPVLRRVAKW